MAVSVNWSILSDDEASRLRSMQSVSWGSVVATTLLAGIPIATMIYMFLTSGREPGPLTDADHYLTYITLGIGLVIAFAVGYYFNKPASDAQIEEYLKSIRYYDRIAAQTAKSKKAHSTSVRSKWEEEISSWVKRSYPTLRIIENDRTTITSEDGNPLELDILLPDIGVAIEANGEKWHDHYGYNRDRENGTCYSEEMFKEEQCQKKGIKLVHVWDSQDDEDLHRAICDAIEHAQREC